MGQQDDSAYAEIEIATTIKEDDATNPNDGANLYAEQPAGVATDEKAILLRFTVGSKSDLSLPDNAVLRDIDVRLHQTTDNALTLTYKKLKNDFVESLATWNTYDGSSTWNPDEAINADGVTGEFAAVEIVGSVAYGGTGATNASLEEGVKENKWDFGSTINLIAYSSTTATSQFDHDGGSVTPKYRVRYEIPTPPGPDITVTPQDNGIDGYINITKHSTDHTNYLAVYDTNSETVSFDNDTGTPLSIPDSAQDQIDTALFATGGDDPLTDEDKNEAFSVYAEDTINDDAAGGQGNTVFVARPKVLIASCYGYTGHTDSSDPAGSGGTALSSAQADIGDEVAIVVLGKISGAATGGSLGFFKHVYVNWDSGASDTNADYTKYTLDEPAITTVGNIALTHRYSTATAKTIKVQIEDVKGWRSNKTAFTTTAPTPPAAVPVASVTASRTKALVAKYGDRSTAVVISGQQSRPVGSNRKLVNYAYTYTSELGSTIVTSNALNNDNSVFDEATQVVSIEALGVGNLSATKFKVFGLASFTSAGVAVIDSDTVNFSHYKPASSIMDISATQAAQGNCSDNFFKTIDCVVCTVLDEHDSHGDRFVLRVDSTNANLRDGAIPVINPDIRVTGSTSTTDAVKYRWGGFAQLQTLNTSGNKADFTARADTTINLGEALNATKEDGIVVSSNMAAYAAEVIQIDDELMRISGTVAGPPATIDVDRNLLGSVATTHDNGTDIYQSAELQLDVGGAIDTAYSSHATAEWLACGFYPGDIIKIGYTTNNGTVAVPKYFKIKAIGHISAASGLWTRLIIEPDTANMTPKEIGYLTTNFTTEANTRTVVTKHNDSPSITAAMYNTADVEDVVTFHHAAIDDSGSLGENSTTVRFAQPLTLDLDTLVTDGSIAIESATMSRSGGVGAAMNLGEARYPTNVVRTQMGLPRIKAKIHVLTQAGLRDIFSLVEGDRFDFVFLDSRKVDTPTAAYRQYRMKLESGSLVQDGGTANRYLADCSFIVVGEDVT